MASDTSAYALVDLESHNLTNLIVSEHVLGDQDVDSVTKAFSRSVAPESTSSTPSCTPASEADRESDIAIKKQRRVRTGCFTCRERHLKCDEAQGQCQNCRKSGRICKRGIRLNFLDIQVAEPPYYIRPPPQSTITFRDDSRTIASEYVGGLERYPPPGQEPQLENYSIRVINSRFAGYKASNIPFRSIKYGSDRHARLDNREGMLLMQVFVEDVAPWMDTLDVMKHFTHILPFYALEELMLYNAFAACGARHLSIINPSYGDEKGSHFYSVALRMLFDSLKDSSRDSALCATAATALIAYEMMCLPIISDRNHLRTGNALIRECQWSLMGSGLGGACFGLTIVIDLLISFYSRQRMSSDPDAWGIDMNFSEIHTHITENEEIWARRILYICAKVSNLYFASVDGRKPGESDSNTSANKQHQEWATYNGWCDKWMASIPRSMLPLGYLHPWQTNSESTFPQIWLLKRPAILAQLFYHISRIMLTGMDPSRSNSIPMRRVQHTHACYIFGVMANLKDRGLALLFIPLFMVAAQYLITRNSQEETLGIIEKVIQGTGWKAEQIKGQLYDVWGWNSSHRPQTSLDEVPLTEIFGDGNGSNMGNHSVRLDSSSGAMNPDLTFGDFSMGNDSYEDYLLPSDHED